jgi:hypothetical protein
MDYKFFFATASVVLSVLQYAPYIRGILLNKIKPHVFSWFIWGLPCGIIFAAQLTQGGGMGTWATAATTAFCTGIFLLSFKHGEKSITLIDWISLGLALIAIFLWMETHDPLLSVVLITLADILGFIPTVRKSIAKPHEEGISAYAGSVVKWIFSMVALDSFSLTTTLYPIAMIVCGALQVVLLVWRRKVLAKTS